MFAQDYDMSYPKPIVLKKMIIAIENISVIKILAVRRKITTLKQVTASKQPRIGRKI